MPASAHSLRGSSCVGANSQRPRSSASTPRTAACTSAIAAGSASPPTPSERNSAPIQAARGLDARIAPRRQAVGCDRREQPMRHRPDVPRHLARPVEREHGSRLRRLRRDLQRRRDRRRRPVARQAQQRRRGRGGGAGGGATAAVVPDRAGAAAAPVVLEVRPHPRQRGARRRRFPHRRSRILVESDLQRRRQVEAALRPRARDVHQPREFGVLLAAGERLEVRADRIVVAAARADRAEQQTIAGAPASAAIPGSGCARRGRRRRRRRCRTRAPSPCASSSPATESPHRRRPRPEFGQRGDEAGPVRERRPRARARRAARRSDRRPRGRAARRRSQVPPSASHAPRTLALSGTWPRAASARPMIDATRAKRAWPSAESGGDAPAAIGARACARLHDRAASDRVGCASAAATSAQRSASSSPHHGARSTASHASRSAGCTMAWVSACRSSTAGRAPR